MASTLPDIIGISMPFAANGSRSNLPDQQTTVGDGSASLSTGFPPETSLPLDNGGVPPGRADMNAMAYLATLPLFRLQQGGYYTFSTDVANKIGGYPQGAVLYYLDNSTNPAKYKFLMSAVANNMDNFVTTPSFIGTSWIDVTPYADGFVRLAGDTMTGSLTFTSTSNPATINTTGGRIIVSGGTTGTTGGNLRVYGDDYSTNAALAGGFALMTTDDGAEAGALIGYRDARLLWFGKDISLGHPNYAAAVQSSFAAPGTSGTNYTAPSGGFVAVVKSSSASDGYLTVSINNVLVCDSRANNTNRISSGLYPVSKGDKISATSNSAGYFLFVPNK